MLKKIILIVSILIVSCSTVNINSTVEQTFEWDLSYKSLLERNNVSSDEWLSQWLFHGISHWYKPRKDIPIKQILSTWDKEPIISSILLEQPAFHAGEQLVFWFIGTSDSAYYWMFKEGEIYGNNNGKSIDYKIYNSILKEVSTWEQMPPFKKQGKGKFSEQAPEGFFAFLSIYNKGISKQILLSIDEFYKLSDPSQDIESVKHGRVIETFKPLIDF